MIIVGPSTLTQKRFRSALINLIRRQEREGHMFKIFVGNLPPTATADAVRTLFSRHAEVDDVALALNPETNKPRGFAIVMIRDEQQGKTAIQLLRGTRLNGRALIINPARKKKKGKDSEADQARGPRSRSTRGAAGRRGSGPATGRGYAPRARSFGSRPPRPLDRPERDLGGPLGSS
jgi:cold-inducible RNA-binding protein